MLFNQPYNESSFLCVFKILDDADTSISDNTDISYDSSSSSSNEYFDETLKLMSWMFIYFKYVFNLSRDSICTTLKFIQVCLVNFTVH